MFKEMPVLRSVEVIRRDKDAVMRREYVEGHPVYVAARLIPGGYKRPKLLSRIRHRAFLAWLVFTGRCDALYWGVNKP